MGTFRVIDGSGSTDTQCFISKYTYSEGSDNWYAIGSTPERWGLGSGWELVAFRTAADCKRRGWYVKIPEEATCFITFYGFDRDIGLQYT